MPRARCAATTTAPMTTRSTPRGRRTGVRSCSYRTGATFMARGGSGAWRCGRAPRLARSTTRKPTGAPARSSLRTARCSSTVPTWVAILTSCGCHPPAAETHYRSPTVTSTRLPHAGHATAGISPTCPIMEATWNCACSMSRVTTRWRLRSPSARRCDRWPRSRCAWRMRPAPSCPRACRSRMLAAVPMHRQRPGFMPTTVMTVTMRTWNVTTSTRRARRC